MSADQCYKLSVFILWTKHVKCKILYLFLQFRTCWLTVHGSDRLDWVCVVRLASRYSRGLHSVPWCAFTFAVRALTESTRMFIALNELCAALICFRLTLICGAVRRKWVCFYRVNHDVTQTFFFFFFVRSLLLLPHCMCRPVVSLCFSFHHFSLTVLFLRDSDNWISTEISNKNLTFWEKFDTKDLGR